MLDLDALIDFTPDLVDGRVVVVRARNEDGSLAFAPLVVLPVRIAEAEFDKMGWAFAAWPHRHGLRWQVKR